MNNKNENLTDGNAADFRNNDLIIAFLLLEIESDLSEEVLSWVRAIPSVKEAYMIYGEWDLIIKVKVKALPELTKLVMQFRKKTGIKRSSTLITLSN